jgi:hypothetical protein
VWELPEGVYSFDVRLFRAYLDHYSAIKPPLVIRLVRAKGGTLEGGCYDELLNTLWFIEAAWLQIPARQRPALLVEHPYGVIPLGSGVAEGMRPALAALELHENIEFGHLKAAFASLNQPPPSDPMLSKALKQLAGKRILLELHDQARPKRYLSLPAALRKMSGSTEPHAAQIHTEGYFRLLRALTRKGLKSVAIPPRGRSPKSG